MRLCRTARDGPLRPFHDVNIVVTISGDYDVVDAAMIVPNDCQVYSLFLVITVATR